MTRRSTFAFAATTLALAASWPASARADQAACFNAPVEGQKLRKAGKLQAARVQFLSCAQKECPAEIVGDCAQWASEVERALPSIVVAARDGSGRDLAGARASIDGGVFAPLSERAMKIDPGKHTLAVRTADGAESRRDLTIAEGEHDRSVVVTFGASGAASQDTSSPEASRPVPPLVWVFGAVGAVGILSFATFGALGVSARSSANCDVGCSASDKSDVDTKLLVADVSLGVGLVSFGVAAALYLMRPNAASASAWLQVAPTSARAIGLGGRF